MQEASGYLRERSFDFGRNKVGALTWNMDKNFQGTPIDVTEFDGSDMGPRQAFLNYQERFCVKVIHVIVRSNISVVKNHTKQLKFF